MEYLIGYEGNAFAFTGNIEEDLLSIAAVHPMWEEAVSEFLARADAAPIKGERKQHVGQPVKSGNLQRQFHSGPAGASAGLAAPGGS